MSMMQRFVKSPNGRMNGSIPDDSRVAPTASNYDPSDWFTSEQIEQMNSGGLKVPAAAREYVQDAMLRLQALLTDIDNGEDAGWVRDVLGVVSSDLKDAKRAL